MIKVYNQSSSNNSSNQNTTNNQNNNQNGNSYKIEKNTIEFNDRILKIKKLMAECKEYTNVSLIFETSSNKKKLGISGMEKLAEVDLYLIELNNHIIQSKKIISEQQEILRKNHYLIIVNKFHICVNKFNEMYGMKFLSVTKTNRKIIPQTNSSNVVKKKKKKSIKEKIKKILHIKKPEHETKEKEHTLDSVPMITISNTNKNDPDTIIVYDLNDNSDNLNKQININDISNSSDLIEIRSDSSDDISIKENINEDENNKTKNNKSNDDLISLVPKKKKKFKWLFCLY